MGNNNTTSYIWILGVFILGVFTYISAINILPNNIGSDSYYSKIDGEMIAKIEDVLYVDKKLTIRTSGDAEYGCIKTTKTRPNENSSCWVKINDNSFSSSIFKYNYRYG